MSVHPGSLPPLPYCHTRPWQSYSTQRKRSGAGLVRHAAPPSTQRQAWRGSSALPCAAGGATRGARRLPSPRYARRRPRRRQQYDLADATPLGVYAPRASASLPALFFLSGLQAHTGAHRSLVLPLLRPAINAGQCIGPCHDKLILRLMQGARGGHAAALVLMGLGRRLWARPEVCGPYIIEKPSRSAGDCRGPLQNKNKNMA